MKLGSAQNRLELRAVAKCALWVPFSILVAQLFGASWFVGAFVGVCAGLGVFNRKREVVLPIRLRALLATLAIVVVIFSNWSAYKAGVSDGFDAASRGEATKRPNQSPEPTAMSVTPRADARVAPATTVAHL